MHTNIIKKKKNPKHSDRKKRDVAPVIPLNGTQHFIWATTKSSAKGKGCSAFCKSYSSISTLRRSPSDCQGFYGIKKWRHMTRGLPRWLSGKESSCQRRTHKRLGFESWVGKIPWSRKWQASPVSWSGKFYWQGRRRATVHGAAESQRCLSMHKWPMTGAKSGTTRQGWDKKDLKNEKTCFESWSQWLNLYEE